MTKGKEGALIRWSSTYYNLSAPLIQTNNPAGSGDATIDSSAVSNYKDISIEESFGTAMTMGF
ncbi:hypothetical protein [Alkalibacterium iburiense]|uniref:hypothetical protein n=1 Tax=Alkalibacterium iburiense TaxID=290589 RepID=UPI0031DF154B